METLFENTHIRNKELAKEMYGYYYFRRPLLLICYLMIVLSLVGNIFLAIYTDRYSLFIFLFAPIYLLLRYFGYRYQVNMMVKRQLEAYGKEIVFTTTVTCEDIQLNVSTGEVTKLKYSNIKKGIQTTNLIILHTKANLGYIFSKNGFTKGTKDDFILFLREKGIKIR